MRRYAPASDLWIVACYFNPNGFRTKRENLDRFVESMSGLNLVVVECAFGDEPFDLPSQPWLRQVRARDVMWQKERLLNLAIEGLPPEATKVAWLDADVLFENPDWAVETSLALETSAVVQPFDTVVRLPKGETEGKGDEWRGFAARFREAPNAMVAAQFDDHGHTGFAWAARRDVVSDVGLYDACVSGSGDHMMAHGFCGDWDSGCIARILGTNNAHRAHFEAWCRAVYPRVKARVGFVPGRLLHLWHGDMANRRYVLRNRELASFGFDPSLDLRLGESGCWEWTDRIPELPVWAVDYYAGRLEDG